MHRIDNNTVALVMPALGSPGPKPDSYFTMRTRFTAAWLNSLQEEICYTITEAGLTLTKGTNNQLLAAINQIISDAGPIPPPVSGDYGEIDTANYYIGNQAAGGDVAIRATGQAININTPELLLPIAVDGMTTRENQLFLTAGSYIEFFADSTNYEDYDADYTHVALTEAAIEALIQTSYSDLNTIEYHFGAVDINGDQIVAGSTAYFWGYTESVTGAGADNDHTTTNYLRPFSPVIPDGATDIQFRVLSCDIWVNNSPGSGQTFTFTLNWASSTNIVISNSDQHGSIGVQDFITTPTTAQIRIVSSAGANLVGRICYRIKTQSFPVF